MTHPSGSRRPLAHLAYLEALAECEEDSARWHALTAGYAALQMFDYWAAHDLGGVTPSDLELRRVQRRIDAISPGDPIRRCLTHLVEALSQPRAPRGSDERRLRRDVVGRIVAAYGKLLQYESSWALSRDVYATLIDFAVTGDDDERLLDAMLMVAFCHRMLGQLDEARDAYSALRDVAAERRSEQYLLLSELGFAKVAIQRGNLPVAAGLLDQILSSTEGGAHGNVRAKALMDRARVATQLGDLTTALVLGHQALEHSADPADRERTLINMGVTLTHMGLRDEARDAFLIASATAQEINVRWMARVNLMELAYLERNEMQFESHRRAMADAEMPPYIEVVYHEARAHGFRAFERFEEASRAFRDMLKVAERHGLNEFVVKAENALRDVEKAEPPLASAAPFDIGQRAADVAVVTSSLSRMREHAGL